MSELSDKGISDSRKDMLSSLIAALLENLSEDERKRLLRSAVKDTGKHRETIEMVEH